MTHTAHDLWARDIVALLQTTERTTCDRGLALWTTRDWSVFCVMVGFHSQPDTMSNQLGTVSLRDYLDRVSIRACLWGIFITGLEDPYL